MTPQTDKPKIAIVSMGGTIAGKTASRSETLDYPAGVLKGSELAEAIPEVLDIATLEFVQLTNKSSTEFGVADWVDLARKVQALAAMAEIDGIVITHGTSTLEESAAFLQFTVRTPKPIVLVGSMRPSSAISTDGPLNLLQAVSVAATSGARDRGVLVVANDRIYAGIYVAKTHTTAMDTFQAHEQGCVGYLMSLQVRFYFEPSLPWAVPLFDVPATSAALPTVALVCNYIDSDLDVLDLMLERGCKGIVLVAAGNGSISKATGRKIDELIDRGVPVVMASYTGAGNVTRTSKHKALVAGVYNPLKARILMMLMIRAGHSIEQMREIFSPA